MKLELDLANPSFTLLHRAGLAGLWMTLKQLEKEKISPPQNLSWQLSNRKVILNWEGNDLEILEWLIKESFQIKDGVISLRGLDLQNMRRDVQIIVHQGILGTFLQHSKTRQKSGDKTESLSFGENEKEIQVSYKALKSYAHQNFASELCDKNGKLLTKPISIAGWLNPGAVVRHNAFNSNTSFQEPPENAFVLLFAIVACYYYILRSNLRDQRAQYALVIPEITDLEKYANYRQNKLRNANYKNSHASSLGDAGLKFLTLEKTIDIMQNMVQYAGVPRCQVITFGTVAWSSQQKTRTDMYVVEAQDEICQNYQVCKDCLSDKLIEQENKNNSHFVSTSLARELIAENLIRNQPWYLGISEKVNSNELFKKLAYERRGLYQVVQNIKSDEREKLFVKACHEAIKFRFGQIAKQAEERGEVPNYDREVVRVRTGLSRCKNSDTFREFITDFWSRAGKIPTLGQHWQELMEFIMVDKNWKKSRDLALLALASYPGKGKLEQIDEDEESEIDIDI